MPEAVSPSPPNLENCALRPSERSDLDARDAATLSYMSCPARQQQTGRYAAGHGLARMQQHRSSHVPDAVKDVRAQRQHFDYDWKHAQGVARSHVPRVWERIEHKIYASLVPAQCVTERKEAARP